MNYDDILNSELRRFKLDIASASRRLLADYASEIEHWNKAVNLTALHGSLLVRRLLVEPAWVGQCLQMAGTLLDVGSGNGSPGIPLSLTRNFERVLLVEPRTRRAAFLRHVIGKLSLCHTEVARERIEAIPPGSIEPDWITMQAIEPTEDILACLNKLKSETTRVVWITSKENSPFSKAERIDVPGSTTKIWVFRLDQT